MSKLPFRTSYQIAQPGEVDRINQENDYHRARALEPAPQAIQRIQQQKNANSARIAGWMEHPDERVQVALIRAGTEAQLTGEQANWWSGQQGEELTQKLWQQHTQRARQEGVVWTPVLDELVRGCHHYSRHQVVGDWLDQTTINEQLAPLAEWLGNEAQLLEVGHLLQFRSRRLAGLVGRHTGVLSPRLAELLQRRPGRGGWDHPGEELARNRHLNGEELVMVARKAAQVLDETATHIDEHTDRHDPTDDYLFGEHKAELERLYGSVAGLRRLWKSRREEMEEWPEEVGWALVEHLPRETQFPLRSWRQPLAVVLEDIAEGLTGPQLEKAWENFHPRRLDAARLMSLPHGTPEMWEKGIQTAQEIDDSGARTRIFTQLAKNEQALQHDWVQQELLEASCRPALRNMAQRCSGNVKEQALQKLQDHLEKALEQVEQRSPPELEWLLAHPLSTQKLRELYEICSSQGNMVILLLDHEAAGADFAYEVLQTTRARNVRQHIARDEQFRNDDRIYNKLLQSSDRRVIRPLLKDCNKEEFVKLMARYVRKVPTKALDLLEDLDREDDHRLQGLDDQHLTPLLTHPEREIRQRALMLTKRMDAPTAPPSAHQTRNP